MTRLTTLTVVAAGLCLVLAGVASIGLSHVAGAQDPRPMPRVEIRRQLADLLRSEVEVDTETLLAQLPTPDTLAQDRARVSDEMMKLALTEFLAPPSPSGARGTFYTALVDYLVWSQRRLEARLELMDHLDDQIKALAQEVVRLRKVEQTYYTATRADASTVTPRNLLELEYHRLNLESMLARLVSE